VVEAREGGGKQQMASKWPAAGARHGRAQGGRRAARSVVGGGDCASVYRGSGA
jgi:hypothetical protein